MSPSQPDIDYHPNYDKSCHRTTLRLQADSSLPNIPLSAGFPENVVQTLGYISPSSFPLPTLSKALQELSTILHSGRGFFVRRTIPTEKYTTEELVLIYAGTPTQPTFLTDTGDLIALLALESAAEGGTSKLASVGRIYNELARTRPDLINVLAELWLRPLLFHTSDHIIIQWSRRNFTGFGSQKRNPSISLITEAQAEALGALHFLAEKFCVRLELKKGDIQYINSLGILHAREAFRDDEMHNMETPQALRETWNRLYAVPPED
ncbi:hypothetical protein M422DRAFT_60324 [Sphaerobolus stellatus SS14]|uniref:TauD/TfdA-like domain-containing protein n=1 Tax=Sphaerobolus stellatus (strain SS14) TaxID=990650 RepID=A0A0C9VWL0_SPHS4|nr:hypothetical protein M422DRAFT_60324 [Sphaerobolus stellatus SS14]